MKKTRKSHCGKEKRQNFFSHKKVKTLLLCFVASLMAGTLYAQQTKFDVNYQDKTIIEILNDLKGKTGYTFVHRMGVVPDDAKASCSMNGATLEEILDKVLVQSGFSYSIEGRTVTVVGQRPANRTPQQRQNMIPIVGVVVDKEGHPIFGVAVVLKSNPLIGTASEENGTFSFLVPQPPPNASQSIVLFVSFLGKKPTEVTFSGQPLRVVLEDDIFEISGAVVNTGIFNRPRESYTGASSTYTREQLEPFRGQNLIKTLGNIDPSINILANNDWGSDPNRLPDIVIRGGSSLPLSVQELNEGQRYNINTPLIIMDGFEISLQKLMDYNDDEIESINIFKDAAATAIYGSRGANGVIVIISKQPTPGQLKVNVQVGYDFEMPDLTSYNLMNATEKLQLEWDNGFYSSTNPQTDLRLKEIYNMRYRDVIEGTDTYWLSKPLRSGVTQRYNLRLDGGSQEFRWGLTAGNNRVGGVMKGSHRDNFNGQITLQYNYKNIIIRNASSITVNKGVESNYGSFSTYANMNPYFKLYDDNDELIKNFISTSGSATIGNPLYNAFLNSINESGYTQFTNNVSVDWTIVKGLTMRGRVGISKQNSTSDNFVPPGHTSFTNADIMEKGRYTYRPGESNNYDGSINLGYSKLFNEKHLLYAGLDYSMSQRKSATYTFEGRGFLSEKLNSIGSALSYPTGSKPQESESFTRNVGFTSNVNYTFDNRLYADFSVRLDGNSQFGSNNRFAPFWSAGIGWNLHREKFLKGSNTVSNLRLRLSYGQTGSQQFSSYQAIRMFNYYTNDRYGAWTGAYLQSFGNEDLKWQITDQFNTGLELGLWSGKLTASADFYLKKTSNLLSNLEIPLATGFENYVANIGEVKNTGFEASLGTNLIRNRNILWSLTGRIAYNKNEITKLSEDLKRQTEEYLQQDVDVSTLFYEGYSQNALYVVRSLGIDPSTGQEIFLDREGNVVSTWRAYNKVYAGVNEPLYRGNFSTMFRYKNLTLNLSFSYHWGGVVYNSTLISKVEMLRSSIMQSNVDLRVLTDRWNQPGDIAMFKKIPSAGESDIQTRGTTRFVMNDRVLQMQTATLEYRLDRAEWLKKVGIQNMRISANMSDLFYISSVKRERGTSYPFSRRVGLALNLMF